MTEQGHLWHQHQPENAEISYSEALRQIDGLHREGHRFGPHDGKCKACGYFWPCPTNQIIEKARRR